MKKFKFHKISLLISTVFLLINSIYAQDVLSIEFVIEGVKTTIPFHQKLMKDENFRKGKYTTKFMDDFSM